MRSIIHAHISVIVECWSVGYMTLELSCAPIIVTGSAWNRTYICHLFKSELLLKLVLIFSRCVYNEVAYLIRSIRLIAQPANWTWWESSRDLIRPLVEYVCLSLCLCMWMIRNVLAKWLLTRADLRTSLKCHGLFLLTYWVSLVTIKGTTLHLRQSVKIWRHGALRLAWFVLGLASHDLLSSLMSLIYLQVLWVLLCCDVKSWLCLWGSWVDWWLWIRYDVI